VTAVPLAAVFTEKNPDTAQMERFVYVQQQGELFEKRNVKVGVSDFFYAEIQDGLAEGEVVSLELPKEEREKKTRQMGKQKAANESASANNKVPLSSTNLGSLPLAAPPGASPGQSETPPKSKSGNRRNRPTESGS
jgi:hypothetical protein